MTSCKRVQVAVLCFLVVVLPATALAAPPLAKGTVTLQPCGDESNASGEGKLQVTGFDRYPSYFRGTISLSCRGLTRGSTYLTLGASGEASRNGAVTLKGAWGGWEYPLSVTVYRLEPDALVPVLCGTVHWVWQ